VKRCLLALTASVLFLTFGVELAAAADPPPTVGSQTASQAVGNDQWSAAAAAAAQTNPTNENVSVRVLSPGNDGPVTQTNSVDANANSSNTNTTTQTADQEQSASGANCCPAAPALGVQTIDQNAASEQASAALALANQEGATNTNSPVRVWSEGDAGPVSQTNSVDSNANSSNANTTAQTADQDQGSGGEAEASSGGTKDSCCPSSTTGIQTASQTAANDQDSLAAALANQEKPENSNISIRVLSPGNSEGVTQTNSVESNANSSNSNSTTQSAEQEQAAGGGAEHSSDGNHGCCPSKETGIQIASQNATNEQGSLAAALANQEKPENSNISIRVFSPGNDGPVSQTNSVTSNANSSNSNSTAQTANQNQGSGGEAESNLNPLSGEHGDKKGHCCPSSTTGIQVTGQNAESSQHSAALSGAFQKGASNTNMPIRVLSEGDDGPVTQTNSVESNANSSNANTTTQTANQNQAGGSGGSALGIQVIGQEAKNDQFSAALSAAIQEGASNTNSPIRVWSPGAGGAVTQTNSVESNATSSNSNATSQSASQDQQAGGSSDKCCKGRDLGIQVIGQQTWNNQASLALSLAAQKPGEKEDKCGCTTHGSGNTNNPLRVISPGADGPLTQENTVSSTSNSSNSNATTQAAEQLQSAGSGSDRCCPGSSTGIQVAGQAALSSQVGAALAAAFQHAAKNGNSPFRVWSEGMGGSVAQTNDADALGNSANANRAGQNVSQHQAV
jgi:hypothetical protein